MCDFGYSYNILSLLLQNAKGLILTMEFDAYTRYLNGDDSAVGELVREYSDGLILYIYSYVRDLDAAEELCSETFIKLVTKKPQFKRKSSFRTFLYSIGRNTALDYLRKHSRRCEVPLEDIPDIAGGDNPELAYIISEQNETLRRAVLRLKPEYSQVLWLTYFENLSANAVSEVMKRSVRSVESLLYRAKPALRKELEKEGFEYENL